MASKENQSEAGWNFDQSYSTLAQSFYQVLAPTPVQSPQLVMLNGPLADQLGLNRAYLQTEEGVNILAGNRLPAAAVSLAQAYAGHQFGHFTMLGDGRALLIGEQLTPSGQRFDLQLKGAGRTSYSRGGDGRAALGPMLREYIVSEAMHALGVPTTRSLAVVTTGETVLREKGLVGAILTRVASSHLRVGTFQYIAQWGSKEELKSLADYTIGRHFPVLKGKGQNPYLALLQAVIERQAELIAKWQLIGFVHGVMNTDNMTLSGETIDYGPCAFIDLYDPAAVFSSIDQHGRYAYNRQPMIAQWNLARFAETLIPLIDLSPEKALFLASESVIGFEALYNLYWQAGMRKKLGLFAEEQSDLELFTELLQAMEKHGADYTDTFRRLTLDQPLKTPFFISDEYQQWWERWQTRLKSENRSGGERQKLMESSNPTVIPRNHLVEEALQAAADDQNYEVMKELMTALAQPYDYSGGESYYTKLPPAPDQPYQTFCGT